jgi:hypothetical protein
MNSKGKEIRIRNLSPESYKRISILAAQRGLKIGRFSAAVLIAGCVQMDINEAKRRTKEKPE